jgi:hypothetical protein
MGETHRGEHQNWLRTCKIPKKKPATANAGRTFGFVFSNRQNSAFQQEAKVNQDSDPIDIEDITKHIDSLIQRGLRRVETEQPAVSILDYIRLLQLSPQMQREEDLPEIIWMDDLDNFDLPEAA